MQIEHRMDAKRGNLIWLSDGRTEAAAALDFGIRIVHLSCAGKPNLFYSQPDDLSDGLATEAGWRIYGGHRFWSSPESTRSYYPDNAPVACELLADGVCLRQRTNPWTGFEKTLILRFLPDGRLSAEHILTNRNPQTVQAAAWGVCTLRGGGTARIPFPGGTAGEYTPGRVLSLWGQTSLADERLQFGPEEICAADGARHESEARRLHGEGEDHGGKSRPAADGQLRGPSDRAVRRPRLQRGAVSEP